MQRHCGVARHDGRAANTEHRKATLSQALLLLGALTALKGRCYPAPTLFGSRRGVPERHAIARQARPGARQKPFQLSRPYSGRHGGWRRPWPARSREQGAQGYRNGCGGRSEQESTLCVGDVWNAHWLCVDSAMQRRGVAGGSARLSRRCRFGVKACVLRPRSRRAYASAEGSCSSRGRSGSSAPLGTHRASKRRRYRRRNTRPSAARCAAEVRIDRACHCRARRHSGRAAFGYKKD